MKFQEQHHESLANGTKKTTWRKTSNFLNGILQNDTADSAWMDRLKVTWCAYAKGNTIPVNDDCAVEIVDIELRRLGTITRQEVLDDGIAPDITSSCLVPFVEAWNEFYGDDHFDTDNWAWKYTLERRL